MPDLLFTFLSAAAPITELRLSIPLGIAAGGEPLPVFIAAFLGSLVPMLPILYWLDPIQKYCSARSELARRFFEWLFQRTRRKLSASYQKYGVIALCLFVAIPLPATGVWTGSIAAWLFGIPKMPAIISIALGSAIAGVIVTTLTVGVKWLIA